MPLLISLESRRLAGMTAVVMLSLSMSATGADPLQTRANGLEWTSQIVLEGGRIDAIAWLGEGVVAAGSRAPNPGRIFRSTDYGRTWTESLLDPAKPRNGPSVTCIASDRSEVAYLLTSEAHVWKSTDRGLTWKDLGRVSHNPNLEPFTHSYGLVVLRSSTVLMSDTNPPGGHIFRSEDGGQSWNDLGAISTSALYRFEEAADGVLINGWAGHVYKSVDDGKTWADCGQVAQSPLYATETLIDRIALQASESGEVFRSTDNGNTWEKVTGIRDPADDFVLLGRQTSLLSTYEGRKNLYVSRDFGRVWENIGPVPTGVSGDVLDHAISVVENAENWGIGASKQGALLRFRFAE
jgi:photosystem II stability/assembly factor-like uncharacterized protein